MARSWTRSTTLQPPRVVRLRRWTRSRWEIMDGSARCDAGGREARGLVANEIAHAIGMRGVGARGEVRHARLRGGRLARRKPRVRRAGVEIERQRGGWVGGVRGAKGAGWGATA